MTDPPESLARVVWRRLRPPGLVVFVYCPWPVLAGLVAAALAVLL